MAVIDEAAKITVLALGVIKVGDSVINEAQALVDVGYTVSVKTADGTKISALGVAIEPGAGTISFTVTEDATPANTADTESLSIGVNPVINVKPAGNPGTDEFLGAGAIYTGGGTDPEGWGSSVPVLLGVTKGGSAFTDNAEFRSREADGDYFQMKGARDCTKMNPQLTANALTITKAALVKYYSGMTLTEGTTYDEIVRDIAVLTASYNDHIWWIGKNRAGKNLAIRLDNALGDTPFAMSTNKDDEIVLSVVFTAHADPTTFDITDTSTYPYAVFFEK